MENQDNNTELLNIVIQIQKTTTILARKSRKNG